MPIEIKELLIKAVVDDSGQSAAATSGEGQSPETGQDALIEACVERVLEILNDRKER